MSYPQSTTPGNDAESSSNKATQLTNQSYGRKKYDQAIAADLCASSLEPSVGPEQETAKQHTFLHLTERPSHHIPSKASASEAAPSLHYIGSNQGQNSFLELTARSDRCSQIDFAAASEATSLSNVTSFVKSPGPDSPENGARETQQAIQDQQTRAADDWQAMQSQKFYQQRNDGI